MLRLAACGEVLGLGRGTGSCSKTLTLPLADASLRFRSAREGDGPPLDAGARGTTRGLGLFEFIRSISDRLALGARLRNSAGNGAEVLLSMAVALLYKILLREALLTAFALLGDSCPRFEPREGESADVLREQREALEDEDGRRSLVPEGRPEESRRTACEMELPATLLLAHGGLENPTKLYERCGSASKSLSSHDERSPVCADDDAGESRRRRVSLGLRAPKDSSRGRPWRAEGLAGVTSAARGGRGDDATEGVGVGA